MGLAMNKSPMVAQEWTEGDRQSGGWGEGAGGEGGSEGGGEMVRGGGS